MTKKLLTVTDIVLLLRISRSTFYKMLANGDFPPASVRLPNGRPRWFQEVVDNWLDGRSRYVGSA